jgi:hypothetical protein
MSEAEWIAAQAAEAECYECGEPLDRSEAWEARTAWVWSEGARRPRGRLAVFARCACCAESGVRLDLRSRHLSVLTSGEDS